ncbi:MAG TPA: thiamine-phosphate kinase [Candidatus Saccharimonadales bacterium]|nr:thiamine-phosphate kinase [Candidatus Saccharimonadales bacterium]
MNENEIIGRIAKVFPDHRSRTVELGLGDDAALWRPRSGYQVVLTCDWFLEGTHFLRDKHPADAVGWKCLARAASDIAAMGAKPRCFLLSMAVPLALTGKWFDGFLRGLKRASSKLRCELAGGDTTRQEQMLINVTVIGEVRQGHALRRSGASAGDSLFVSGRLGEADAGLAEVKRQTGIARATNERVRKHLYPEPRLALGTWLAEGQLATAAMDLSDGLSSDLPRLCAASGVGARVEVDSLPVVNARNHDDALQLALHGGDDYELLFTVAKGDVARVPRAYRGLKLTRIGEITREKRVVLLKEGVTRKLEACGWDPFRK